MGELCVLRTIINGHCFGCPEMTPMFSLGPRGDLTCSQYLRKTFMYSNVLVGDTDGLAVMCLAKKLISTI